MPIPKPEKNEEKTEFMNRCIINLLDEYKKIDQVYAICIKEWEESQKNK